jgi:hypothetical protein
VVFLRWLPTALSDYRNPAIRTVKEVYNFIIGFTWFILKLTILKYTILSNNTFPYFLSYLKTILCSRAEKSFEVSLIRVFKVPNNFIIRFTWFILKLTILKYTILSNNTFPYFLSYLKMISCSRAEKSFEVSLIRVFKVTTNFIIRFTWFILKLTILKYTILSNTTFPYFLSYLKTILCSRAEKSFEVSLIRGF